MKKLSSGRSYLKFAIVFCIIFCVCSNDANASRLSIPQTIKKSYVTCCLAGAPDFYYGTINAGTSFGTAIRWGFKNSYHVFLGPVQIKQPDYRLKFSFYIFSSGNLKTRLRKSDIIYPFHYFW